MSNNKTVYWLDEIGQEHNDIVGKKCANLGELLRAGFPVPFGFALSLTAYDEFLKENRCHDQICRELFSFSADPNSSVDMLKFDDVSRKIRSIVESNKMPAYLEDQIQDYYDKLCQKLNIADTPVATRSAGTVSHPGQFETYLYVKGISDVLTHIIKVWSSTFNTRSIIARARQNKSLDYCPIGVAVIQMIEAKAAGVLFTVEPTRPDFMKMVIEGNWGLGESVVSGRVTPDSWTIDRTTSKVIESKIALKELEYRLDQKSGQPLYAEVSPERQRVPCLTENNINELVQLGKNIEHHFNQPQDIEWAIKKEATSSESVLLLQTRPQKLNFTIGVV